MKNTERKHQFCVFYFEGECVHGDKCRNPHIDELNDGQKKIYEDWKTKKNKRQFTRDDGDRSQNDPQLCKFFRRNACTNDRCRFIHTKDNDYRGSPCYFFFEHGFCSRIGCRNNHKKAFTKEEHDRYNEWRALKPQSIDDE